MVEETGPAGACLLCCAASHSRRLLDVANVGSGGACANTHEEPLRDAIGFRTHCTVNQEGVGASEGFTTAEGSVRACVCVCVCVEVANGRATLHHTHQSIDIEP